MQFDISSGPLEYCLELLDARDGKKRRQDCLLSVYMSAFPVSGEADFNFIPTLPPDDPPTERRNAMKVTISTLREMKAEGQKITMLTAYDFPTARMLDEAGIDTILVGDSLGNVVLGFQDTLPVTMEHMIHHAAAVMRGAQNAFVWFDMPFMSYQVSVKEAVRNAGRAIKETGCHGVKLEGCGSKTADIVRAITECGIPVCGHLGLTPQSVNAMGGFKAQGKAFDSAKKILEDSIKLEEAGAGLLVLECVPWKLAGVITKKLSIPTIGIGAGPDCDGQVLVFHDMVGLSGRKPPKFVRSFADAGSAARRGVTQYIKEVKASSYPTPEHSFTISDQVIKKLGSSPKKKATRK